MFLRLSPIFFFFYSTFIFARAEAVSDTAENCIKYLVQERILEEYQKLKKKEGVSPEYLARMISLSVDETLLDKSHFSSWFGRGELWNFVTQDSVGLLYEGYLWAEVSYLNWTGQGYICRTWDPMRAKVSDVLFFLDLNEDQSLPVIRDRGYISESTSSFGGSPRPAPMGRGGVYWPQGR